MSLFRELENTQAYLKCGLLGFAGSGKSTTASHIALGLSKHLADLNVQGYEKPVFYLDTETGSDWFKPLFLKSNIKLLAAKTRAFKDLISGTKEAEKSASILIIDSISHFWNELTKSYMRNKNRQRLQFQDWAFLKAEWERFTELFVNTNLHIIMCGRAGYEYDFFEDEDQKKQLEKTGIKMKAESETGYETSLTVLMERYQDLGAQSKLERQYRTATILKDRSGKIDGKMFENPTFKDFYPHIEFLNLGGQQTGIDVSRNSDELFNEDTSENWHLIKQKKEIVLDEIREVLVKHHPSQSADDKKAKGDLVEKIFGTRSWEKLSTYHLDTLERCRNELWVELEGKPYTFSLPKKDSAPITTQLN